MRAVLSWVMSLVFLSVVAAAAMLTLWACALNLPGALSWIGSCPLPAAQARAAQLSALEAEGQALKRRIALAEDALAGIQCTAAAPDPNRPFDPQDWQDARLGALYGCWDLGSDYQTRNVDHRDEVGYPAWQMCFDQNGNGRQIMRDMDGIACEGPVTGGFAEPGLLRITEAENLPCGDGGYIHRRDFTCRPESGAVTCDTIQPETDGQMQVTFRRAARRL